MKRLMLATSLFVAALLIGSSVRADDSQIIQAWVAALAAKLSNAAPRPTANTFTLAGKTFHLTLFGPGIDPSSIYDFNGFVGVAEVQGTGTATNPDGSTETLLFDTDMRFMSGVYVGVDGAVHKGAFAFV